MTYLDGSGRASVSGKVDLPAVCAKLHDELAALHEVGHVLVAERLADKLGLAREVALGDSPAPGRRDDLEDAFLRLFVVVLGHGLLHGADEVAHEVLHETAGVDGVALGDDGLGAASPHGEDERHPAGVLQRLAVEVVRLVARLVGLCHFAEDLVVERLERVPRAVLARHRAHGRRRVLPRQHLRPHAGGDVRLRHEARLRTRLRDEEQVPREPAVPQVRLGDAVEKNLRLRHAEQAHVRIVDHGGLRLLVALGDALLAFPPSARAAPQLQKGGLQGVERGAGRLRVRDAREKMPTLVNQHRETRVAPERVLHRRVARHLSETQVRGLARVERARHGLERVILPGRREAHAHHVDVRALPGFVLHVPPVERARETQRGGEREDRLRTDRRRVDPVHRRLNETAGMLKIAWKVVLTLRHGAPPPLQSPQPEGRCW